MDIDIIRRVAYKAVNDIGLEHSKSQRKATQDYLGLDTAARSRVIDHLEDYFDIVLSRDERESLARRTPISKLVEMVYLKMEWEEEQKDEKEAEDSQEYRA